MVFIMNICNATQITPTLNRQKVEPPKLYNVLLLNDDFTPMDFVVNVLTDIFFMSFEQAERIMLTVHHHGSAVCGIYAKDIAQMKVEQVLVLARVNEHPLQCIMEEAE